MRSGAPPAHEVSFVNVTPVFWQPTLGHSKEGLGNTADAQRDVSREEAPDVESPTAITHDPPVFVVFSSV